MHVSPRRIDLIALALLVALVSLGYTFGLKGELARVRGLEAQVARLDPAGGRGLERDLAGLSAEIAALEEEVARLKRELPDHQNLPAFLAALDELCRANGVRLAVVRPEPAQQAGLYLRSPLSVSGEASFPGFYRLLYGAEQMGQALAIDRLKVERPEGLETCRFELAISLLSAGGAG